MFMCNLCSTGLRRAGSWKDAATHYVATVDALLFTCNSRLQGPGYLFCCPCFESWQLKLIRSLTSLAVCKTNIQRSHVSSLQIWKSLHQRSQALEPPMPARLSLGNFGLWVRPEALFTVCEGAPLPWPSVAWLISCHLSAARKPVVIVKEELVRGDVET